MSTITKEFVREQISIILGEALIEVLNSDPREAAEAAFLRGGPSVDELEARIREMQAECEMRAAA